MWPHCCAENSVDYTHLHKNSSLARNKKFPAYVAYSNCSVASWARCHRARISPLVGRLGWDNPAVSRRAGPSALSISLTQVTFRLWIATPKRDYTDKLLYHQALN